MTANSGTPNSEESMLNQNELPAREFRLELFGGPTLYRGDSIVRLSPQESLLLGLLGAFGREGLERDELLDLLWTSGTRKTLRLRLGQLLHIVRRKSGCSQLIVQHRKTLYLNDDVAGTDLAAFSAALTGGDYPGAVQILKRGPFSRVRGPETHTLASIIEEIRKDTVGRMRVALSRAVQQAEAGADFPGLVALASLQVQLDGSDESALRCLVRALGAQGRFGEARAEYRSFAEAQSRCAPAWSPSPETQAILSSLAKVSGETPWIRRHLRHVGSLSLPMLGRESQRAALQGILDRGDNPKPRLIAITADPGVGRSRILHETLRDIELAGAVVLFARCGGGMKSRSLHPISEALATPVIENALAKMAGAAPRIIRDTVLARPYEHIREPDEPAKGSFSLSSICESLVQLFLLLSHEDDLVIALDDAHLADPDTLHLITYMIRRGLPSQVTIILAVDDSDVQAANVLGLGEAFTHMVDSYVLPLEPLQEDSLERLAIHILGNGRSGDLISAIASLSGGSPKQATSLCELVMAASAASLESDEDIFGRVISECSAVLPRLTMQVLFILAVADASVPVHCIAELLQVSEDTIRLRLGQLTLGWVRSTPLEYTLASPYVGSLLYSSLPLRDRRALHIDLAQALEELDDFGRSNQIATHLVRGGEHSRAVEWIERALVGAVEGFDPTPSVALAEELLQSGTSPDVRMRLNALLGRHWLRSGQASKSAEHLERALSLGRSLGIGADLIRTVEVTRLEAWALERERAAAIVLPEIHRLKEELTRDAQWDLLARVLHVGFRCVDAGGLPDLESEFLEHIAGVIGPATDLLKEDHLPLALVFCSQLRKGQSAPGQAVLATALRTLRSSGDEAGVAKALQIGFLGKYHSGSLNTPEGILDRRDSLEVARGLQDSTLFCRHHLNTAVWYLDTFDLDGAAEAISRAEEYASNLCPPQLSRELTFNRAELLYFEGKAHEALRLFLDGYRASPTREPDAGSLLFAAGAACCYARMRREDEARQLLPSLSYLTSRWSVDLSLLLRAHGELASGKDARLELLEQCDTVLEQLHQVSVIWHLKALYQVCDLRHRFSLPSPRESIQEALEVCSAKGLPYMASRLRSYLRA